MSRGRDFKSSTILNGRQYAVSVEGAVITFECSRAGHAYKIDFGNKPVHRRLSTGVAQMMARWWSREKGGCIGTCPKCERAARAQATKETT